MPPIAWRFCEQRRKCPRREELLSCLGCTTTSAAKNTALLAQVRPTHVIIEEAAEILTSLGPSVQQLIIIGDHLQLRPKLECYQLRKKSHKGIDFDVSLFERLALQPNFPVHTLQVQHHMRPEISELIRATTYPQLIDHPSVVGREDIKGVSQNCDVIFLNHGKIESADEDRVILGMNSKINPHEVDMVIAVLKYFLQQGYHESEIVILAPYLGQLVLIQRAVRSAMVSAAINDRDFADLKKIDGPLGNSKSTDAVFGRPLGNSKSTEDAVIGRPQGHKIGKAGTSKQPLEPHAKEDSDEDEEEDLGSEQESVRVATVDNF